MPDEGKPIQLNGYEVDLMNGNTVFMGFDTAEKADAELLSYYFIFKHKDGRESKLRLSLEAFDALVQLQPKVDAKRWVGDMELKMMVALKEELGNG
jgi:hypothetical protein